MILTIKPKKIKESEKKMRKISCLLIVILSFILSFSCSEKDNKEESARVIYNLSDSDFAYVNNAVVFSGTSADNIKKFIRIAVVQRDSAVHFYYDVKFHVEDLYDSRTDLFYPLNTKESREGFSKAISYLENSSDYVIYSKRKDGNYVRAYYFTER